MLSLRKLNVTIICYSSPTGASHRAILEDWQYTVAEVVTWFVFISQFNFEIGTTMALFKTCCFYLTLRTGCILFGLLVTLLQVLLIVTELSRKTEAFSLQQLYSIEFIAFVIGIISSALLIGGAFARNRLCLWVWLVVNAIGSILSFILGIHWAGFLFMIVSPNSVDDIIAIYIIPILMALIPSAILILLFTPVVYSYICELRENERQENSRLPHIEYRTAKT